jgi:hypothetical protein
VATIAYSAFAMAAGDSSSPAALKSLTAVSNAGLASVEIRLGGASSCDVVESKEVFIVGMTMRVGDRSVFVPRSAYADLVAPTHAVIEFRGAAGTVTIRGGDGAEAYVVKLFFDRQRVHRRTFASLLVANQPTEETRYLLRILKDE